MAELDSIEVDDKEVDRTLQQQIDNIVQQAGSEEAAEVALGQPLRVFKREYWYDVKDMLITQKYQQQIISKVRVNNKEVRTFFKSNKDKIENFPNLMKIRHILFKIKPGKTQTNKTLSFLKNLKFLPKVIEYDRYQPEFYEDTYTYVSKRANIKKVNIGLKTYKKNTDLINKVEKNFNVEKELLLSLMGIETNFGKYLGKMDILSSLATLSYDKRRSEFFTKELSIALKLIDHKKIKADELYGSWAGAFGNFQFMPSTILNNAIDYDNDNLIDLKSSEDSFASAANYLNKIGWRKNEPCFFNIELNENIPKKLLNTSAKKIKHKRKFKYYKKYIKLCCKDDPKYGKTIEEVDKALEKYLKKKMLKILDEAKEVRLLDLHF